MADNVPEPVADDPTGGAVVSNDGLQSAQALQPAIAATRDACGCVLAKQLNQRDQQ